MIAWLCMIPQKPENFEVTVNVFPQMAPQPLTFPDGIEAVLPIFFDYEKALAFVNKDITKLEQIEYPDSKEVSGM